MCPCWGPGCEHCWTPTVCVSGCCLTTSPHIWLLPLSPNQLFLDGDHKVIATSLGPLISGQSTPFIKGGELQSHWSLYSQVRPSGFLILHREAENSRAVPSSVNQGWLTPFHLQFWLLWGKECAHSKVPCRCFLGFPLLPLMTVAGWVSVVISGHSEPIPSS